MTLALLLTAATGAWADETPLVTINASSDFQSGSKTFDNIATVTLDGNFFGSIDWAGTGTITVTPANDGVTITSVKFISSMSTIEDTTAPFQASQAYDSNVSHDVFDVDGNKGHWSVLKIEVYGTAGPPLTVAWDASTKTGTFEMPGSDVVLTPIYAKAAAFATTGTGSEAKTLLPEAAEGVIAGTDAPLIAQGTGIVANIGETTTAQGTLMYAIGTSATEAPALTAFSATVPTAENVADDGADVYVWYYIQGADAPQGEAATLDNTFSDTEPACLTVQVLTNKFDIQLSAANANTIEAGKATVTIDGAAATVTDGKLQGVKMGSEVKLEAKPGYKFRKVEVKKKEAPAGPITVTWNNDDITGSGYSFTKDGVTITAGNIDFTDKNFENDGTFTTTLGNFTKIEVTTDIWNASGTGWSGKTWTGNASSVSFSGNIIGMGSGNTKFVFTIEPTN